MSWFIKFLKRFIKWITPLSTVELERARDGKGRYIADDPSTPENEAYTPKKKANLVRNKKPLTRRG
jgi:hypothetical protein